MKFRSYSRIIESLPLVHCYACVAESESIPRLCCKIQCTRSPTVMIAALSSDFGHFSHLSKVHLNPLPLVVGSGNVRGRFVDPSLAGCIGEAIGILTKAVN